MTARATRRLFAIHRLTGAFVALNLLVLSVTGVLLVFHDEIDALLEPQGSTVSAAPFRPLPELVAAAERTRQAEVPLFAFFEEGKPETAFVGMAPPGTKDLGKAALVVVDARTARPSKVSEVNEGGFMRTVLRLHAELLLGSAGKLLVGLIGAALLVSLITGLLVYGPAMRRFWFGLLRREGRRSLLIADLHKLVGATLAGWLLVVVVTGVLLTLGTTVIQLYQVTTLAEMTGAYAGRPAPARRAPLATVVSRAEEAFPGEDLAFVTFPGTEFSGDHHFGVFTRTRSGLERKLFKIVLVDAETGAITAAREMPWFVKALLLSEPLHFGDYGGLPLKILWALFGLGTAVLSGSALYVFVARRRGRRSGAAEVAGPLAGVEQRDEVARAS